jgi:hypothetical protein
MNTKPGVTGSAGVSVRLEGEGDAAEVYRVNRLAFNQTAEVTCHRLSCKIILR